MMLHTENKVAATFRFFYLLFNPVKVFVAVAGAAFAVLVVVKAKHGNTFFGR